MKSVTELDPILAQIVYAKCIIMYVYKTHCTSIHLLARTSSVLWVPSGLEFCILNHCREGDRVGGKGDGEVGKGEE